MHVVVDEHGDRALFGELDETLNFYALRLLDGGEAVNEIGVLLVVREEREVALEQLELFAFFGFDELSEHLRVHEFVVEVLVYLLRG